MSQESNIGLSAGRRIVMVALCLLLIFTVISKPITVDASAAATIAIGAAGSVAKVAIDLLPIILVLVAVGYNWDTIVSLAQDANSFLQKAPTAVKNWVSEVVSGYANGILSFEIPQSVRDGFLLFPGMPITIPTSAISLLIPSVEALMSLDSLSMTQIFSGQILGSLLESNSLLGIIKGTLLTLRDSVVFIYEGVIDLATTVIDIPDLINSLWEIMYRSWHNFCDYFLDLYTELKGFRNNAVSYLTTIYERIHSMRNEVAAYFVDTYNEIKSFRNNAVDYLTTIYTRIHSFRNEANNYFNSVKEKILALPSLISESFSNLISKISPASWIQSLLDSAPVHWVSNSFNFIKDWINNISSFFFPSDSALVGDDQPSFWDFLFGRNEGSSIWESLTDNTFLGALHSFYDFVAALWLTFPLGIKFFLIFGFCFPFMFSIIKLFVG